MQTLSKSTYSPYSDSHKSLISQPHKLSFKHVESQYLLNVISTASSQFSEPISTHTQKIVAVLIYNELGYTQKHITEQKIFSRQHVSKILSDRKDQLMGEYVIRKLYVETLEQINL